ncbi:phage integrase central domain-containing protein [Sphingopyxis granuli]|uniref:phage integrase central domain-containing protein n=1 Tax=Sphingopyxis granuli TaxID=267128 RepID=UPI003B84A63C
MVQSGRAHATIVKANFFLEQLVDAIGSRPIDDIEPFEVLAPLKRLEAKGKHETAKKTRSFASRVFLRRAPPRLRGAACGSRQQPSARCPRNPQQGCLSNGHTCGA